MNWYTSQDREHICYAVIRTETKDILYCYRNIEDAIHCQNQYIDYGWPCQVKELHIRPTSTAIALKRIVAQQKEKAEFAQLLEVSDE